MKSLADATVYAVTYINLREDSASDDDSGALESISALLVGASEKEKDELAEAAKRALMIEERGANRKDWVADYGSWMEEMLGEEWEGNERAE